MVKELHDIYRIRHQDPILDDHIKNLEKSTNECSPNIPLKMMLTKEYLDQFYYTKGMEFSDYNIINKVIKDIGIRFNKCRCISTEIG